MEDKGGVCNIYSMMKNSKSQIPSSKLLDSTSNTQQQLSQDGLAFPPGCEFFLLGFRWYRSLLAQPPANGYKPSGFESDRPFKFLASVITQIAARNCTGRS